VVVVHQVDAVGRGTRSGPLVGPTQSPYMLRSKWAMVGVALAIVRYPLAFYSLNRPQCRLEWVDEVAVPAVKNVRFLRRRANGMAGWEASTKPATFPGTGARGGRAR
jgi:hypothetical protein